MEGDTVWNLTAIPLTPIHVGDGSVMAPEEWRIGEDGRVERFRPSAVLRAMPPRSRDGYVRALDQGDLQNAQRILREAVTEKDVIERIAVGPAARAELEEAVRNPLRRGDLRPFVRTGGRPYIPGSSIKGAIRTALLSDLAQAHLADIETVKGEQRNHRGGLHGRASDQVQRGLLRHETTDQDPFRFVRVADLPLPDDATRIDRVVNWRPARLIKGGAQPAEKMQMIFERAKARTDGIGAPRMKLQIRIDGAALEAARKLDPSKAPDIALGSTRLREAINEFHWKLLDDERDRFFKEEPEILAKIAAALRLPAADGKVFTEGDLRQSKRVLLLRVGRFGQFESKSLENVREGWNAQGRPAGPMSVGNTRNLLSAAQGQPMVPMGWLICTGIMP